MFPLQSILCPVDFSEHSRRVLSWAAALAARDNARLVVVSVLEPLLSDVTAPRDVLEQLQHDAAAHLDEWIDEIVAPDSPTERRPIAIARRGTPDEAIVETATEYDSSLIVMGTHGFTGVRKLLLGSVTTGVLRRTHVPVFAVPFDAAELLFVPRNGLPVLAIDRVLVATDLGPHAFATASCGAALARSFHARLTLLHVEERPPEQGSHPPDAEDRVRSIRAVRELDELADRLTALAQVDAKRRSGVVADEIGIAAVEENTSVIVMGLVAAGGIMSKRPGSVAYRVMCLSAVPILAVPPQPAAVQGAVVDGSAAASP